jgi:hypothetical protein
VEQQKEQLRQQLSEIRERVNQYLRGEQHERVREFVRGLEPGNVIPSWLTVLESTGHPERTDGKSLGTYIEKLLKAEIARTLRVSITGSSALGVDIPELGVNTKATSDRQPQSSEPFSSAYERVLGARFDILVCIYNGEDFWSSRSAHLQIVSAHYLKKTEVADRELCQTAKMLQRLSIVRNDEDLAKRALQVIAYAKKGGGGPKATAYRALKRTLASEDADQIRTAVEQCEDELFVDVKPEPLAGSVWQEFLTSPLDGRIGISFALQWRYQFRQL